MDIPISDTGGLDPRTFIRRAGYAEHFDRSSGETSYVRRLAATGFYPRFHAYLHSRDDGSLMIRLHLDQKKPSYGVGHAHSGDYEGPVLDRERERILQVIEKEAATPVQEKKRKGFLSRLLGV